MTWKSSLQTATYRPRHYPTSRGQALTTQIIELMRIEVWFYCGYCVDVGLKKDKS